MMIGTASQVSPRRTRLLAATLVLALLAVAAGTVWLCWAVFFRPMSPVQVIGVPLPPSATDIKTAQWNSSFGGDHEHWISARMPRVDFLKLMNSAGLRSKPDLLNEWPGAFTTPKSPNLSKWWCANSAANQDTYFARGLRGDGAMVAAKYEDGRLYLRKQVP